MRPNPLKQIWSEGGTAVNCWLSVPGSYGAEILAHTGFDSLTIDLQHGVHDYMSAFPMLQAISTTKTVPLARIAWLDEAIIMKLLDAGAQGLICPMIETAADVERFVRAALYPPMGIRSFGPNRAWLYSGADYNLHANDEMVLLAMIETKSALDHLDAILDVPGLTGIYVGPSDLAAALGDKPLGDRQEPWFLDILKGIADKVTAKGLIPGIHTAGPEYTLQMAGLGYRFITAGSDVKFLNVGAKETTSIVKKGLGRA